MDPLNSPGHGPIGVSDLRLSSWLCCCCFQTAQSGRPRALGGQSRWQAVGPDPRQSPSGPWRLHMRDGFFRRIQDSPLKCRDSSRRSTSIFKTVFFKKVSNLKTFLVNFPALIEVVTGPCKNAVNRACGHLGGPLGLSIFFLWPLRAPQEPPGRGKSSVLAPSSPRSPAEQIDCIFAMDYGALGPPTL